MSINHERIVRSAVIAAPSSQIGTDRPSPPHRPARASENPHGPHSAKVVPHHAVGVRRDSQVSVTSHVRHRAATSRGTGGGCIRCVHVSCAAVADVTAHRGASAYAPEHTFAAYDLALEQGAEMLELDVRPTADGELLVVHDPTLLRTALDSRHVSRLTRGDVMALDPLVRPLTLDAVFERYGRRARLLVELKEPTPVWEQRAVDAISRHGLADEAIVQSFDARALRRLRTAAPCLAVASLHLVTPITSRRLRAIARYAGGIGVWHRSIDQAFVLRAHAAGLAVRAWTVNGDGEIERLLALGVDGIITDVPDVARAAIARASAAAARVA